MKTGKVSTVTNQPKARLKANAFSDLQDINLFRIRHFTRHIKNGGKVIFDLGCGNGEFPRRLAEKQQALVIGIEERDDELVELHSNNNYLLNNRFLFLPCSYGDLVNHQTGKLNVDYRWLKGTARQTFMIMPCPYKPFDDALVLWRAIAAPGSELHVRTENPEFLSKLRPALKTRYRATEIPFDQAAAKVESHFTRLFSDCLQEIAVRLPD